MKKCFECANRENCQELCDDAEAYANQDHVKPKELPIGLPRYKALIVLGSNVYLTRREREILTLLGRGLGRADVCQVLRIKRNVLRWHIHNLRKKTNDFYY